MREHDLQAPQRAGHAHGPKAHDGTITTEAPDVMWGTDMTATVTVAEGPAFVFVAVGGEFVRIRDSVRSSRLVIWNHPEHRTDRRRQRGG